MKLFLKLSNLALLTVVVHGQVHIEQVRDYEADEIHERVRTNATQSQFPYQIYFQIPIESPGTVLDFSGSLIEVRGTQAVLTSAFWLSDLTTPFLLMRMTASELKLNTTSGAEQERRIGRFFVHPNFSRPYAPQAANARYNIALVFPDPPFQLNANVQPISLPKKDDGLQGNFTVTGWSRRILLGTYGIFVTTNDLNYAKMPLVDKADCQKLWSEYDRVLDKSDDYFCAGGPEITSCSDGQGDPAVNEEGCVVGIATTIGCPGDGSSRVPRIYTKISEYLDWIEQSVDKFKND